MNFRKVAKVAGLMGRILKDPPIGILESRNLITTAVASKNMKKHNLESLFAKRPPDAYQPDHNDLWYLYSQVRQRRPELVVEFGSGCSTIVIAQAIRENGTGSLFSVESEERWKEATESSLPDELRDVVTIEVHQAVPKVHLSKFIRGRGRRGDMWYKPPERRYNLCGIMVHTYPELSGLRPNFFYLDGPDPESVMGYHDAEGKVLTAMGADLLDWENSLPNDFCMVIDARLPNMHFLRENLKRKYKVNWDRANKRSTFILAK